MKKRIVIQLDSEVDNREQIIIEWLNKQPKDRRGTRIKEGLVDLIVSAISLENHSLKKIQDTDLVNEHQASFSRAGSVKTEGARPSVMDSPPSSGDAFKEAMKKLEF